MNLLRTLTRMQKYYLEQICSGKIIVEFDVDRAHYVRRTTDKYVWVIPHNKPRPPRFGKCRGVRAVWLGSVVVELKQRGVLIDVNGRLMPSKDAIRLYGSPPSGTSPSREIKMSRTRAARNQEAHVPE